MGEKQGHTPGPWVAQHTGFYWQIGSAEGTVADACPSQFIDGGTIENPSPREEANARLIAAAPDLLAAVWALVEHFERVDGDASHKAVIKQATDAIGKAANRPSPTGEDSPANEGEG